MKVVLTEKPSVAMDLGKALGSIQRHDGYIKSGDYFITWAVGHLIEINDDIAPRKWAIDSLPILPERFNYQVSQNKKKQFHIIQSLLKKAKLVVIATDAGREGELIARLILYQAKYDGPLQRFWTSEALSTEVIRREFNRLKDGHEFDSLYYSALGRQHADWLFGINLTRLTTIQSSDQSVWSVGRVQTPVLKFIVDRELEIQDFKPEPYWNLKAIFTSQQKTYTGLLLKDKRKKTTAYYNEEDIQAIAELIKNERQGEVAELITKENKQKPPLLHSLTTLQQEANKLYGFSAKHTLELAQTLYEAKKISYPRTDAQHLDEQKETKELIKNVLKKLGKDELVARVSKVGKRVFNTKKLTDHYAIIPLQYMTPEDIGGQLTKEHYQLYILIARRLTGTFMDDYCYQTTTLLTRVLDFIFLSRGKMERELGWKSLYLRDKKPKDEKDDSQALPVLAQSDLVEKENQELLSKQTKPPQRFKESGILSEMKKLNLGTPATRASIIETLKRRDYIVLNKKNLVPLEKGLQLIQNLEGHDFTQPEMTAQWEEALDDIYKGKKDSEGYLSFLSNMKALISKEVGSLKSKTFVVSNSSQSTDEVEVEVEPCSSCQSIEEFSKGYKCKVCGKLVWKEFMGKVLTPNQAKKILKGKSVPIKGLRSRQGKKFNARVQWEEGKLSLHFDNDDPALQNKPIGRCQCEGPISELPKLYKCKECEAIVWKNFLKTHINKKQAIALLQGETVAFEGLKSRAGKVFNAKGTLGDEGKIDLSFT